MSRAPETTVVIGGGLAGTAMAITLAQAGEAVTLLERDVGPRHKVCGEFLSAEALGYLDLLGVDAAALGAVPIEQVRLCGRRGDVLQPLPFHAASLTRRRLDEALLARAESCGVNVQRGCVAEGLAREGNGWRVTLRGGETLQPGRTVLATGKHDLRGHPRPAGAQPGLVAMKMYWRLSERQTAALAGHVELITFRGGYAGLQPVEDGAANLCALVQRDVLRSLGGTWEALLRHMIAGSATLQTRLAGGTQVLPKPLALSGIPYGYVADAGVSSDGLWRLGDQAAVIPSFTGDGMSMALHGGVLAARRMLAGGTAAAFAHELRAQLRPQVRRATWISRAMVNARSQAMALAVSRAWPGTLRRVAAATRIPGASIQR